MKTPALIALSLGAPLVVAATLAGAEVSRSVEADLRNMHAARAEALARADREFLSRLVDEDFRYTSARGDWLDRTAYIALDEGKTADRSIAHIDVRVRVFGDVGLVHGVQTRREAGGAVRAQRYTDVYRNDGKAWKLVSAQLSDVANPASLMLVHEAPPEHAPWSGPVPAGDDEQVLRTLNAGYVQAFLDSNVGWYDAHLAPDYLVVFSDGSFHDKDSLLAAAAHPVTNMRSFPTINVSIRRFGDVALIHAENPYERTDGLRGVNRYTDIWLERDGRWICIAAHVTRHKMPS